MFRIARTMREKKLPCDVLIYLGTGWCPSGWNEWHGSLDFNKKVFPDWDKDIRELQSLNYKVSLHVVGQPTRLYGLVSDPVLPPTDLNRWAQYWKLHDAIGKVIDAWWPDVGENMDDASRIARIRMYWEGLPL
jgi:alpha-glucosidase/alpha-D-xyloside xylohydrolase